MRDDDILIGSLMEDSWLTLEQVAAPAAWNRMAYPHIEEGFSLMQRACGHLAVFRREPAARAAHAAIGA